MGVFDIIVSILILIALINGWRKGLTIQLCSIIAIIGGIWLASAFGTEVGSMLEIDPRYAKATGFLIIFAVVLIALAVLSRLVKNIFKFVGLGILDSLLGAMISAAKVTLIMGILCSAFDSLNAEGRFVEKSALDKTIFFRPLCRTMEVFDLFDIDGAGKVLEETVKKTVENINV